MKKTIIALAGEMGCGKGAIAEYLIARHAAKKLRFSDVFRNILDRIHLEQSRENMAALSLALRNTFGSDILSDILAKDVENLDSPIIILDGVRRMSDLDRLRTMDGFRFVYIEADPMTRYHRVVARGENTPDSTMTYEGFLKESSLETETSIRALKDIADVVLENNGTLEELEAQCEKMLK